jgi:hypothetical protein
MDVLMDDTIWAAVSGFHLRWSSCGPVFSRLWILNSARPCSGFSGSWAVSRESRNAGCRLMNNCWWLPKHAVEDNPAGLKQVSAAGQGLG